MSVKSLWMWDVRPNHIKQCSQIIIFQEFFTIYWIKHCEIGDTHTHVFWVCRNSSGHGRSLSKVTSSLIFPFLYTYTHVHAHVYISDWVNDSYAILGPHNPRPLNYVRQSTRVTDGWNYPARRTTRPPLEWPVLCLGRRDSILFLKWLDTLGVRLLFD